MEIAVVGNEMFVLGFKLAGIRKVYEAGGPELETKVNEVLADESVGILVLDTKDHSLMSPALRKRLDNLPKPVVISVGRKEEEDLREKVKRAIGIDLYKT